MTVPRWKRALRGDREALGQVGRLECGPETMGGQVRHAGTRIAVEATLRRLARGESPASILKGWPSLRPGDIEAAQRWGALMARIRERLKAQRRPAFPAPRYDEVFLDGMEEWERLLGEGAR